MKLGMTKLFMLLFIATMIGVIASIWAPVFVYDCNISPCIEKRFKEMENVCVLFSLMCGAITMGSAIIPKD